MKKILLTIAVLFSLNAFADNEDGVKPLSDNPTEAQMKAVRDGAKNRCEELDDDNEREICVADYYAQHNLEEEPSCD